MNWRKNMLWKKPQNNTSGFIKTFLAQPAGVEIGRGGGNINLKVGNSRSPEGQYEDLDLNNIMIVGKGIEHNEEYEEVIENMRLTA